MGQDFLTHSMSYENKQSLCPPLQSIQKKMYQVQPERTYIYVLSGSNPLKKSRTGSRSVNYEHQYGSSSRTNIGFYLGEGTIFLNRAKQVRKVKKLASHFIFFSVGV